MLSTISKKIKSDYLPLILVEMYLLLTLFLFYFGPLEYEIENPIKTILFLISYQLLFLFGFHFARRKKIKRNPFSEKIDAKDVFIGSHKFLIVSLLLAIIVSYVSLVSFSFSFNPFIVIKDIITGITEPSHAYAINTAIEDPFITSRILNIILMLTSVLSYYAYAMGVYNFNNSNLKTKLLVVLALLLEISTGLIRGTNISVFRMIVIVTVITILKLFMFENRIRVSRKKFFLIFVVFVIFVIYFAISTSSRMALMEIPDEIFRLKVDKNNIIMRILPDFLKMPFIMISFYLSQGYYAFSLTFNYTFHSTFGVGNGWFLLNNFDPLFSFPFFARTYIAKMRYHWSPTINWHSAYTWFANDVSVYGVTVIMYLLGDLFYRVINWAKRRDAVAITILPLLVLMLLFIPANNVILSAPQTALPFIFFVFIFVCREFLINTTSKKNSNYLFLGGVYEPSLQNEYISKSKGNGIQNAINTHQWNLVNGIASSHNIEILSARYLHSFPNYKSIFILRKNSVINNIKCRNIGFINLPILKQLTKSISLFIGLFTWVIRTKSDSRKIFVYYPSSLLLLIASFYTIFFKEIKLISIIPDLPENTNLSQKKSLHHKLNETLFNFSLKKVDYFILITEQMADYYGLNDSQYFVIEGVIEKDDFSNLSEVKHVDKTVLYSGSLNFKYGIKELVDEFIAKKPDFQLNIFGKGEYEDDLIEISKYNTRVNYLGYVGRDEILKQEFKSHVVVNPRTNKGDYNKYSFPSKNLEYMLSGTPFVGYFLDGIKDEYRDLFRVVKEGESIIDVITDVFENIDYYNALAIETRKFVIKNKNNNFICNKMLVHFGFIEGRNANEI